MRPLEDERYVFFIRPRRFGKSCWLALLECYYGRHWAHEFESLFEGTDVGREPTAERGRYVIVRFDFSAFDDTPETLEERFQEYCFIRLRHALERHPDLFPEAALRAHPRPARHRRQARRAVRIRRRARHPAVHAHRRVRQLRQHGAGAPRGQAAYESLTHGGGFYRNFFAALKAGTGEAGGGLERLFITGRLAHHPWTTSPAASISARTSPSARSSTTCSASPSRRYAACWSSTGTVGAFNQDVDAALDVMREWYNGYRFSKNADDDPLQHRHGALFSSSIPFRTSRCRTTSSTPTFASTTRDPNIRIDYTKLRHLLLVNQRASAEARRLNGNFDLLRHLIGEGEAEADLNLSFPLEELDEPENFLSLLYYFGLLSIRGVSGGAVRLGIPNQTVWRLMYGYLRRAYRDVGVFSVSHHHFSRLVRGMAYKGEWRPAVEYIAAAMAEQTGIRDYIDGEKVVQAFLAAHFSVVGQFLIHSERELNKGYADLHLEPFVAQYPDIAYGYVIEVKYLKRRERMDDSVVAETLRGAREQLAGYLADEGLRRRAPSVRYIGLGVVFHGWELVACEAVGLETKPKASAPLRE